MIFNIIIVDDEFYALKAIETALKWDEIGIKEVYTAANIKQAKDILTTRDIHIMLCDIEMPQGNGLELLSWIKERNPAIKCIFITCHAEYNYAQKAVELGAMEYILKPVSKEKLTEIVRKAIRDIKSEKNLIENSEYGKLWLENMAVVVERFWLDVIEKKIPPVPEKIEKEAKRRGITHNRTEKYLPIFISMQKNDSKDDLQIINNYLRNKAKEVILNEIKNNSGYNLQTGWMFGNQFLSHVWVGNEPDLWKQTSEFNDRAYKSNAIGFVFDQAPVHNEIAALSNVASQYRMALETGSVDPDSILPVFLQKLKANGIDKVVSEKQRQLDEWAAQNK